MNLAPLRAEAWAQIRGLTRLSLCDWPGKSSAVLFFGGCNLRCPHCHNASLAFSPLSHPPLAAREVREFLASRTRWLDGLVICGGEPLLVAGLAAFLSELAAFGLPLKLDTNGLRPDLLEPLLREGLIQACSVDLKAPFAKYPEATGFGVSPEEAAWAFARIFALAQAYPGVFSFRTTLAPELDERDLAQIRAVLPAGHKLLEQPFIAAARQGAQPCPSA